MTESTGDDEFSIFNVDTGKVVGASSKKAVKRRSGNKTTQNENDLFAPASTEQDEFRTALSVEWAFVLERKPAVEKMFVLPMLIDLARRNRSLNDQLSVRLKNLLMRCCRNESILPALSQVEWLRFKLLGVIYSLVRNIPSEDDARNQLREINDQLEVWGISDSSYLLSLLNTYLGMNPPPKPVDGIVLTTAIGGGTEKSRDEPIQKRYGVLTEPMTLVSVALAAADIARILDEEFPWMAPVTRRLCAHIEEQQRYGTDAPVLHKPVLLVGDPGSGKTHYARRFAELTQVPSRLLSIGGMSDNMLLKGSARHWNGSRPSAIAEFITESGCPNPLFILDEIDKVGSSKLNGNPYDTLIQLMEPRNAANFFDECLLSSLDLSRVSYLATANSTKDLPDPLKDRMLIWQSPSPEPDHLVKVAIRLWWQHWHRLGIHTSQVPAPDVELLERVVAKAPSIRKVKSMVDAVLRCTDPAMTIHRLH
ncbi:MAG: hypothetical protein B7X12_00770 [Halothiobacillus sp. 20-53-49]|nr:MAG: hypothetical protein B7X12_00770 [Halothiobacillus sp. 20-53-49]HUN00783.1 AAA family ATPase [Halothiobacillus sp.]